MDEAEQKAALDRFLADNPELEQLSARLATFNVFRALGIETVEIRHSNTLAWLLDPTQSHGLADVFLRRILSNMVLEGHASVGVSAAQVELMEFGDVEVRREWRNIDVLVIDRTNTLVLLIENKVGSGEGRGQLVRYRKIVSDEFPGFRLVPVFLTLTGQASDDEEATDFISYSYPQLLAVLERVMEQRRRQLPDAVSVFMDHYLDTLRRLTMQDEKLNELCKTIYRKHRQAIDLIVEHGMAVHFQDAATDALSEAGDFEVLCANPKTVWFLPQSWAKMVPENATVWPHLSRRVSVACWLACGTDKIRIIFEVCRMTDPRLRLECVKALDKAGFKFWKAAFNEEAQYSRFFSTTQAVSDVNDDDEVREATGKLLTKIREQFSKAEAVFKNVFVGNGN